jgi:hypothetical protein
MALKSERAVDDVWQFVELAYPVVFGDVVPY